MSTAPNAASAYRLRCDARRSRATLGTVLDDLTDHSADILRLLKGIDIATPLTDDRLADYLAADLLEAHDATGISLDAWDSARQFVERRIGHTITPNGA